MLQMDAMQCAVSQDAAAPITKQLIMYLPSILFILKHQNVMPISQDRKKWLHTHGLATKIFLKSSSLWFTQARIFFTITYFATFLSVENFHNLPLVMVISASLSTD